MAFVEEDAEERDHRRASTLLKMLMVRARAVSEGVAARAGSVLSVPTLRTFGPSLTWPCQLVSMCVAAAVGGFFAYKTGADSETALLCVPGGARPALCATSDHSAL